MIQIIMRRRSNLILYLILNIIVSAATTLAVLVIWDHYRPTPLGTSALPLPPPEEQPQKAVTQLSANPTPPLPPASEKVIDIDSVIAPGSLDQEVVLLKRTGEGNLSLGGWKLTGEHNNTFVFPSQPVLILYKGGAIQLYTRAGDDTVTDIYWGRGEAAWSSGETLRLLDSAGNERARYKIP